MFPELRVRNDGYVKVDLAARYLLLQSASGAQTRVLLRIENLFGDDYEEAYGFEAPGFLVVGGVEQSF